MARGDLACAPNLGRERANSDRGTQTPWSGLLRGLSKGAVVALAAPYVRGAVVMRDRRSAEAAGASLDLWADLPALGVAASPAPRPRVGGRQGRPAPLEGGGGYLDECTAPELSKNVAPSALEPRFAELADIGLSSVWLDAAQALGYDRWMALWRHLSADSAVLTDDGQILLRLRDFGHYERMQRDLYIRRLAAVGMTPTEILAQLRAQLGDMETSYVAVKKVASASWPEKRLATYGRLGLSPYLQERMRMAAAAKAAADLFPEALERALIAEACKTGPGAPKAGHGDPRLAELIDIGLSASWLAVARLVGYDDFVRLWRAWSRMPALRDRHGQIELRLRSVRSFDRYQRNRYIETLVAAGLQPSEIYRMVQTELGEKLSFRHLKRLVSASRVPA